MSAKQDNQYKSVLSSQLEISSKVRKCFVGCGNKINLNKRANKYNALFSPIVITIFIILVAICLVINNYVAY